MFGVIDPINHVNHFSFTDQLRSHSYSFCFPLRGFPERFGGQQWAQMTTSCPWVPQAIRIVAMMMSSHFQTPMVSRAVGTFAKPLGALAYSFQKGEIWNFHMISIDVGSFGPKWLKWIKGRTHRVNWVSGPAHNYLELGSGPSLTKKNDQILCSSLLCSWQGPLCFNMLLL